MNRFRLPIPRFALGCAAVAMTVVTFGALVVLPAQIEAEAAANLLIAVSQPCAGGCAAATEIDASE